MCVCVSTHIVCMYRNLVYFQENTSLDPMQDLLILRRNFVYHMAYLPTSMDLPCVFKIHKIQDQSVSTTYLPVCLYSHQQLAFSELCLLAMIAKISCQITWPMTLAPTYEAIKSETSRKPSIRGKPAEFFGTRHQCEDGLLPSIQHNIQESVEMFYQYCEVVPQVLCPCCKHFILLWHL